LADETAGGPAGWRRTAAGGGKKTFPYYFLVIVSDNYAKILPVPFVTATLETARGRQILAPGGPAAGRGGRGKKIVRKMAQARQAQHKGGMTII
jgi:hypothetical protein